MYTTQDETHRTICSSKHEAYQKDIRAIYDYVKARQFDDLIPVGRPPSAQD